MEPPKLVEIDPKYLETDVLASAPLKFACAWTTQSNFTTEPAGVKVALTPYLPTIKMQSDFPCFSYFNVFIYTHLLYISFNFIQFILLYMIMPILSKF